MNDFFATIGSKLASKIHDETYTNPSEHIYRVTPTVDTIIVNKESFSKVFDKIVHTGKSCSPKNVSTTDPLLHKESSIHGLFGVFKNSVKTGLFLSDLKKAKVACVYKKGSKKSCSNYRPISLLSIPSRVVEQYNSSIINNHLDSNNLLSNHQTGFPETKFN